MSSSPRAHFHGLDLARGVAAMAVIVWHWQHFLVPGVLDAPRTAQPLYGLLRPFYLQGTLAVDLFFCLSGFVFFNVYLQSIRQGHTNLRSFWLNRFARLFPLHWAMLLATVLLQWIYRSQYGSDFQDAHDGMVELALQVLMLHYWVPGAQLSWNVPTWSLSIELMAYAAFFVFARHVRRHAALATLLIAAVGLVLIKPWNASIGRGMSSFFMGGLAWLALQWLNGAGRQHLRVARLAVLALTLLSWAVCLATSYDSGGLAARLGSLPTKLRTGFPFYALFPLTVLTLALFEARLTPWVRPLAFIGNASYSVYLIHFPLQIAVFLCVRGLDVDARVFLHPLSLLMFMALTLALGHLSYQHLERPCQRRIRDWFGAGRQAKPSFGELPSP